MLLACFCNQWSDICTDFREKFNAIDWHGVNKHWIEVDEDSILFNGIEINKVPSVLLVSDNGETSFFSEFPPRVDHLKIIANHINKGNFLKNPDFNKGYKTQKVFKEYEK